MAGVHREGAVAVAGYVSAGGALCLTPDPGAPVPCRVRLLHGPPEGGIIKLVNKMLETMLCEVNTLPEEEQRRIARVLEGELRKVRGEVPVPAGRWARFAERMSREAPMKGKSEEFLGSVREFRDHFDLRV